MRNGSSCSKPMARLQLPHSRPRTPCVAWQWSTWGSVISARQIAQRPACSISMASYRSDVRPYFLRRCRAAFARRTSGSRRRATRRASSRVAWRRLYSRCARQRQVLQRDVRPRSDPRSGNASMACSSRQPVQRFIRGPFRLQRRSARRGSRAAQRSNPYSDSTRRRTPAATCAASNRCTDAAPLLRARGSCP